jgi:hypothetical protein
MPPLARSTAINELNEFEKVKEIRSAGLHPYRTGVAREPLDRAYGHWPGRFRE